MGANESAPTEKKADVVKEAYSEAYGRYRLMKDRDTNSVYAEVDRYCEGESEFNNMTNLIEKRKNINCPYLIKVFDVKKSNKQEYCGTF